MATTSGIANVTIEGASDDASLIVNNNSVEWTLNFHIGGNLYIKDMPSLCVTNNLGGVMYGKSGSTTFNIDNSATNQRWLILTEDELSAYDKYVGASITDVQQSAEVETTSSCYYDLQGRRIAKPSRGLYIVGGKKIVVR